MSLAAPVAQAAAAGTAAKAAPTTAAKPRPKWGPGSRGAIKGKPSAAQALSPSEPAPAAEEPSPAPAPERPAGFGEGLREGAEQGRTLAPRAGVNEGAGALLGFLVWVWVVLPALIGGPARVRDVLRAKLTNKGPDGEELP